MNLNYRLGDKIVTKAVVPISMKSWVISWPEYSPTLGDYDFNGASYADPHISDKYFKPKFNQLDGSIDRRSHTGIYLIDSSGYPLNPFGRTGIKLRGILGKWGPNHAADPIVTRWKYFYGSNKRILHSVSGKPILQFVAIQRRDTKDWAIPGGMINSGEQVSETLKREFMEESLNLNDLTVSEQKSMKEHLKILFSSSNGKEIYKGFVDDPRNTDNAWMETVAVNFHDDSGNAFRYISLSAGDDAQFAKWIDIESSLSLYANHSQFIKNTAEKHSAHW